MWMLSENDCIYIAEFFGCAIMNYLFIYYIGALGVDTKP